MDVDVHYGLLEIYGAGGRGQYEDRVLVSSQLPVSRKSALMPSAQYFSLAVYAVITAVQLPAIPRNPIGIGDRALYEGQQVICIVLADGIRPERPVVSLLQLF